MHDRRWNIGTGGHDPGDEKYKRFGLGIGTGGSKKIFEGEEDEEGTNVEICGDDDRASISELSETSNSIVLSCNGLAWCGLLRRELWHADRRPRQGIHAKQAKA